MVQLAYGTRLAVAAAFIGLGSWAFAAPAERHASGSAPAAAHHKNLHHHVGHHLGRRHFLAPAPTTSPPVPAAHHPRVVTFVDGYVQPVIPTPYPYAGKLAGDGILGTGILDSNVLRAFGIVRN